MRKLRYERRKSRSAIWSFRLAVFSVILLLFSALGHRFQAIETPDFLILATLVAVLALLALMLAAKGFADLWRNGDKGGARSLWGSVLALAVLAPFALAGYLAYVTPPLYDISTDLTMPPQFFRAIHQRKVGMNRINDDASQRAAMQMVAYPQVTGRRYEGSPDRILEAVMAVIEAQGWTPTGRFGMPGEQVETVVEAVAHSFLLGFASDIAIRLTDEGETTYVDMRSVSRYGPRDLGLNARFITDFMNALDQQVNGAPPEG
ncbi:hypothetical protein ATN84_00610 [Paramesorhizobium deserti]|uniref:DUF1499 domain-containing protein n=1 Tax=Paramesorhizobium deserti TaxID=1494590 RepID=A0A135HYT3_9HYPH|nr:DUF1499 domain-containing protein [Paramesorhizobium deserti]KXF78339.1 hypothetical protein ATN84_00610 [Paramesorhizobium deserti]